MAKLENQLGRSPTNQELSNYLNISLEELESILADISNFNMASLEDLLDNKGEYYINTDSSRDLPEEIYETKELKGVLANIIDELPENERKVISLYYYEELTYKEIGYVMELSESRISQIHSKSILSIKNQLNKRGISES